MKLKTLLFASISLNPVIYLLKDNNVVCDSLANMLKELANPTLASRLSAA